MIDKIHGSYKLTCDCCGEEAPEDFDTFGEAVDYKTEEHWENKRTGNVWQSICPTCKEAK